MLGSEVRRLFEADGQEVVCTDRAVDITEMPVVLSFATQHRPEWIINCAAYTAVDQAESEPENARALNVTGPRNLARVADVLGSRLIHISTDYVFDGTAAEQYRPEDPPSPLGVYGRTKADGELVVAQETRRHIIIRTSWLYGQYGKNFVTTMLRLMKERGTVRVVNDQWGSPTFARDLGSAILRIIKTFANSPRTNLYGIYHYTNEGKINWYEFACEIARQAQERKILVSSVTVEPIPSSEFPARAPRPANSKLNTEKIQRVFDVPLVPWKSSLARFFDEAYR